jgi:uncharacterized cupredoxin-like copper-binding protein
MPRTRYALVAAAALVATMLSGGVILAQESPAPDQSAAPAESAAPIMSEAPAGSAAPAESMAAGTHVAVTVQEVQVVPETTTIPAGAVTFDVTNAGPEFMHEFDVVRTDLMAADLPTREDGSFDEEGEGVEVVGELAAFAPGTTQSLSVELTPGHYVLLCNVVADIDGEPFSHFQAGMHVDVDVVEAGAESMAPAQSMAPAASMAPAPSEPAASPAS